jgi:hypothetical protein
MGPEASPKTARSTAAPIPLSAIVLELRCAEPFQPGSLNRPLPSRDLLQRKRVALTGFIEREQSTFNRYDHLSFAPRNPSLSGRRWQRFDCERLPKRSNYGSYGREVLHCSTLSEMAFQSVN